MIGVGFINCFISREVQTKSWTAEMIAAKEANQFMA